MSDCHSFWYDEWADSNPKPSVVRSLTWVKGLKIFLLFCRDILFKMVMAELMGVRATFLEVEADTSLLRIESGIFQQVEQIRSSCSYSFFYLSLGFTEGEEMSGFYKFFSLLHDAFAESVPHWLPTQQGLVSEFQRGKLWILSLNCLRLLLVPASALHTLVLSESSFGGSP